MSATDADRYPFGYRDEELDRLGDQHRVWQEETREFLDRACFEEGDTLVDLGCGPGFTTVDLARRVGPNGRVIAVDRDGERSIPRLQRLVEAAGLRNVETRVAELERFDLPSVLPTVVDTGHLTPEVSSSFLAEWEVRCRDPGAVFFSSPVMEVVGRRPRDE